MEFDLQRGLRDLSGAPSIAPDAVPTDRVLTRVHRGRALRATAIGAVSLAVVVGAAVAVYAAPWQPVPPVVTPSPTLEPSPTPDVTPEPTAEPTPTETPEPDLPAIVGLTSTGDLVELDPESGEVGETYLTGLADPSRTTVTVDRATGVVFFDRLNEGTGRYEVVRLSLDTGDPQVVAEGFEPALSPDGRTLAYIGFVPDGSFIMAATLLDLESGEARYFPDKEWCECDRSIGTPAWSQDGSHLFVPMSWTDIFPSPAWVVDLRPDQDASLQDGTLLEPTDPGETLWAGWSSPTPLDDGRLAVFGYQGGPDSSSEDMTSWTTTSHIAILDPASAEPVERVETPGLDVVDMAAAPDGDGLAIVVRDLTDPASPTWSLYRWDGAGGLRGVAQGIVAIAW